jgi:LacI family transcriptional regulator
MSVTIHDIAARLDLSPSTVSRSLRQSSRVHPDTRAQVAALAAQLGYQGRSRRGPSTERGRLRVGLLLRSEESHTSPNAVRALQGLTAESDAVHALLTVHASRQRDQGEDDRPEQLPAAIDAGECDVVVLEGRHELKAVAALAQRVPVVSFNWIYEGVAHDTVVTDNLGGIHAMVDHLVELGHRRLAWVDEWYAASFATERQAAYIQRCLHHGVTVDRQTLVTHQDFGGKDHPPAERLLSLARAGCTAFVCANDRIAALTIRALEAAEFRVPQDVSVTGFDAMSLGPGETRQLTTVDPRFVEMGRMAMTLAVRRGSQPGSGYLRVAVTSRPLFGQTTAPAK